MNCCYLSLGSNQKNPARQLRMAVNRLRSLPHTIVSKVSKFYWNKAWGMEVQQDFCNAVVELKTTLPPLLLLKYCQQIEQKQGRIRKKCWGPRVIDIDITLYGSRTIKTPKLTIPHPYMHVRDFVLIPLKEINPKLNVRFSTIPRCSQNDKP